MSRMCGIYVGKKILPYTIFTIHTVGLSDVSLQRPTSTNTTIADHGRCWQKWPPSDPHEALCSADASNGWATTPRASRYNFWGCWGCVWFSKHSDVVAIHHFRSKERFEGHTHPHPPKNTSTCLGGCCPSIWRFDTERKASCGALGVHFCRRQPWLLRLWCQLCFVLRLLKNAIKH